MNQREQVDGALSAPKCEKCGTVADLIESHHGLMCQDCIWELESEVATIHQSSKELQAMLQAATGACASCGTSGDLLPNSEGDLMCSDCNFAFEAANDTYRGPKR